MHKIKGADVTSMNKPKRRTRYKTVINAADLTVSIAMHCVRNKIK